MPETLEDLTTTRFPKDITAKAAEELLRNICNDLSCSVNYQEEIIGKLGYVSDQNGKYVDKVSGTFIPSRGKWDHWLVIAPFHLFREPKREWSPDFSGLRFFTTPGYDLDELNPHEIDFMGKVKKYIANYFSDSKK